MASFVRKTGARAVLLGLIALLASACASTRPTAARAPVASPSAGSTFRLPPQLDLASIPFDASNAPVIVSDQPPLECVPYARNISGVQIWGDAVTWWQQADSKYVRSGHPAEGSVMVLRGWNDDTRGHVSVVKEIVSERLIRVDHANWLHGGEISLNVPVMDVSSANDWSEVRVWHIPGGYWGGRTYDVRGFIHPFQLNGLAGLGG
jgi:hypothetical protein